ncbi:MAG: BamA/TamA family outer membrane protein [Gemmatimonadales bacterium]|jgi:hypothetical protein
MSGEAKHAARWLLLALIALPGPRALTAQIHRSPPPAGAETHVMIPGERYQAGAFRRLLLGGDYRDLWTTPLEAPVLDFDSVRGGLTPIATAGFGQSIALRLTGPDGRGYVVRSLDKNPLQRLLPELRGTLAEAIVQDQISALHPLAGLVVDPLMSATGILHSTHELVIVPDDPRLGEFRNVFAGLLGMLLAWPEPGPGGSVGFERATEVLETEDLLPRVHADPCDRVDARDYLKARLLDLVIGDRDRHEGQWAWASFPAGECRRWRTVPLDRDQAFVRYDGLVMALLRIVRPQQVSFGSDYPSIWGLTFNGWEVDREFLAELAWPVWDSLVTEMQGALTDEVIAAAVRRLPDAHFRLSGEFLVSSLRARRDALREAARAHYELISGWVDVTATDRDEIAELEHRADGTLELRVGLRGDEPYFRRVFHPSETREVRLYLRGGADSAVVLGGAGDVTVRIVGGDGDDAFVNRSRAGGRRTRYYDAAGANTFVRGPGARVDTRPYSRPPSRDLAHRYALDWGGRLIALPFFSYDPDLGVFVGALADVERYGFRKHPYTAHHTASAGLATGVVAPKVTYHTRLASVARSLDAVFDASWSGIDIIRFHGFGNGTVLDSAASYYEVRQQQFELSPMLELLPGERVSLGVGPLFRLAETDLDDNAGRFIAAEAPYGTDLFRAVGARAAWEIDSRDTASHPSRGILVTGGASAFAPIWDADSAYGEVHGAASVYLTAPVPAAPTLALRIGGKKVWGRFPFHEAAYLGGASDLRGFRQERFAGDAALYANAELRLQLGRYSFLVPGRFGVFGLADAGRVFYGPAVGESDTWHTAVGGGVWLSFINRRQILSAALARSEEFTALYVRAGFLY